MSESFVRICLKKLFEIGASLAVLAALTFLLLKLLPGGPFDDEVALNPVVKSQLMQHWRVEQSWPEQVLSYSGALLKGDLGVSMIRPERTVADIIGQGLRNTFSLNLLALLIVVVGALVVAMLSLRFKDSWLEEFFDQSVITFLALPSLFWGPLLIYFFGFYWNLLPVAFLASPVHYILPLLTLCLRPMAALVRILKNSLNENFRQDYVRTARAKGVGTWRILVHHVLKNSMIPFLSYLGPLLVSLFSGSFLVEVLFAIPGLGTEFVAALNDRDYTLIVGLTMFYGVLLIIVNSVLDVLIKYLDPRLREV